jgi:two-component system cell cycle sensor histidine kinase/response regulator CckA
MTCLFPAVVGTFIVAGTVASIYWYLTSVYRERYLHLWAWSWTTYACRFVFLMTQLLWRRHWGLTLGYMGGSIIHALLLLAGTQVFTKEALSTRWAWLGAAMLGWVGVALAAHFSPQVLSTPVFALQALAFFLVATSLLRSASKPRPPVLVFTAVCFILWGLHKLDYPFLRYDVDWFAPIGYSIGAFFGIATALGILLVFFEKTRSLSTERSLELEAQIEECRQAEVALRESESRLNTILDNVGAYIFIKDTNYRYTYANRKVCELFGCTLEEIQGKDDAAFFSQASRKEIRRSDRPVIERGETVMREETDLSSDGVPRTYWTVKLPLRDNSGNVCGLCGISTDISDRKRAEEEQKFLQRQLAQAHKMEAVGTLAGGIAHDFNNILAAILGYSELAQEEIQEGSRAREYLDQIFKAGNRAKDLVRQILTFSRKRPEAQQFSLQPAPVIKEALKLMRATLPTTIRIEEEIYSDCGFILANPTHIHQVLVNLCTNALHAMEDEKGTLTVKLSRAMFTEDEIINEPNVSAGSFVELAVTDTGHGMDKGTLERIFEPYFTSKEIGKGSGMGLALVHGIVQGCEGFIKVESELGKGTTFHIFFPAMEEKATEVPEEQREELPKGNERILAIDDEEIIVDMYRDTLERLGYRVTAYHNGEEALREFQSSPASFDLIITDQTMPHLTGADLAEKILQIRPDIPIILCTGHSAAISEEKAKEMGIERFVMKPVSRQELAIMVREVLDKNNLQNL